MAYPENCAPPCELVKNQLDSTTAIAKSALDETLDRIADSIRVLEEAMKTPNIAVSPISVGSTLTSYNIEQWVEEYLSRPDCPTAITPEKPTDDQQIPRQIDPADIGNAPTWDPAAVPPDVGGVLALYPTDIPPADLNDHRGGAVDVPVAFAGESVEVPDRQAIDADVRREDLPQDLSGIDSALDDIEQRIDAALDGIDAPPSYKDNMLNKLIPLKQQYLTHYKTERAEVLADVVDSSSLWSTMTEKLGTYLVSGYTHSRGVWDQMRAREREQSARTTRAERQQIEDGWGARGWELPGPTLVGQLAEIESAGGARNAKVSRDMAIRESDQIIEGIRVTIDQTIRAEGQLWDLTFRIQDHVTETGRWAVEFGRSLYELLLRKAELDASYLDRAIETARSRLQKEQEAFRQALEPERLHLDAQNVIMDDDRITYSGRVQSLLANLENQRANYDRLLERGNLMIRDEARLIQEFTANVSNHGARNRTREINTSRFNSRVGVETLRSQVYKDERAVFDSEVTAWAKEADARLKHRDQDIKSRQELPIDIYQAKLDAYEAELTRLIQEIEQQTRWFEIGINAYTARTASERDKHESERNDYNAEYQNEQREFELNFEQSRTNLAFLLDKLNSLSRAHMSAAQMNATLSAGYASATSTSAYVSGSDSTQLRVSQAG